MDPSKVTASSACFSCGGCAFRTDRPYGNFCSMMCSLRGILTDAEKKEESERYKLYIKNMKKWTPRNEMVDAKE